MRGLARASHHWAGFDKILQEAYPHSKVLALDACGNGNVSTRKSGYKISQYIGPLREEFLNLSRDIQGQWNVFGLSMGGMIALEWLKLFPNDFSTGTIVNSSAANIAGPLSRLQPSGIKHVLKIMAYKDPKKREMQVLKMVSVNSDLHQDLLEEWVELSKKYPTTPDNARRQLIACALFRAPEKIQNKTLFLVSEKDAMVSPECTKSLAKKYNSILESNPNAGHDISLDDPKWVVEMLKKHIFQ